MAGAMPGGQASSRLLWTRKSNGKDERRFGSLLAQLQHHLDQANKHADQIPALKKHLLVPFCPFDHPQWHISAPFGLHQMQYLAIVLFLYLPVGSVGCSLHSSFVIGHS